MPIPYSLDVDGVVADYFAARERLGRELGIRPLSQPVGLASEDLDAFMKERQSEIARALHTWITEHMEDFFSNVACTVTDDDRRAIALAAAEGYELFWISARSFFGKSRRAGASTVEVHAVTVDWLERNGLPADDSHVILTPDKAQTITEQGIKFHLDDAVSHVTNIALRSPAKVYLMRRPWNQRFLVKHDDTPDADYEANAGTYGVEEVDSIREYITLIMGR